MTIKLYFDFCPPALFLLSQTTKLLTPVIWLLPEFPRGDYAELKAKATKTEQPLPKLYKLNTHTHAQAPHLQSTAA